MKKTTIAIIAAIVTGAIALVLITSVIFDFDRSQKQLLQLTGSQTQLSVTTLPSITGVEALTAVRETGQVYFSHYETLLIVIDDSITKPRLMVNNEIKPYLKTKIDSAGTLAVWFDFSRLSEDRSGPRQLTIDAEHDKIKLVVPRGSLASINVGEDDETCINTVILRNLMADSLDMNCNSSVQIEHSHINQVNYQRYTIYSYDSSSLALINSKLGNISVSRSHGTVSLTTDSLSVIEHVTAIGNSSSHLDLDIREANISRLSVEQQEPSYGVSISTSQNFSTVLEKAK